MAQRTIASYFDTKPRAAGAAVPGAGPATDDGARALKETTNPHRPSGQETPHASEKRPAPSGGAAKPPAKKRPAVPPRPFSKGASEVIPVPKAEYNDEALEFCRADGRDYLLGDECWRCDNLTEPVAAWGEPGDQDKSVFNGRFKVVDGTNGLAVYAKGSLLRCKQVPDIGGEALATLCLKHGAVGAGCTSCHKEFGAEVGGVRREVERVLSMASYATQLDDPSPDSPNLMVTTTSGQLKLIRVARRANGVDMREVASVLLTEGTFKYAFPTDENASWVRRTGPCVMWRNPKNELDSNVERLGSPWSPITAAVASGARGTLSFIEISPPTDAGNPATAEAKLLRTVKLDWGGRHGDGHLYETELWDGSSDGAAVVTTGTDGMLNVTHFEGNSSKDRSWKCVEATYHPTCLSVCRISDVAVVGSSKGTVHVYDLVTEKRLRVIKLGDCGRPKDGAFWYKENFTLMRVAVGGGLRGGSLIAAASSNRDPLEPTLQVVRSK